MRTSDTVLDARFKKLMALVGLSGGGNLLSATPLVRSRFVDGDTTVLPALRDGAAISPFASIAGWLASLPPAIGSAADGAAFRVCLLSPVQSGAYTENPVLKGYRSQFLKGLAAFQIVNGSLTWHNVADGSGFTPASVVSGLEDVLLTGNFTMTDDGLVPSSLYFSNTSGQQESVGGTLDTTGCTALTLIALENASLGPINAGVAATAARVSLLLSASGDITAHRVIATQATLGGNITTTAGASSTYKNCFFTAATPTLTGGIHTMDPSTYRSFIEQGGILAGGATILVSPYVDFLTVPKAIAAGSAVAGGPGLDNNFWADLTAAKVSYTFNPTPVAGEVVQWKCFGAGGTPMDLTATGGFEVEDPGTPGTYSIANGTVHWAGASGGTIKFQFSPSKAPGVWSLVSQF